MSMPNEEISNNRHGLSAVASSFNDIVSCVADNRQSTNDTRWRWIHINVMIRYPLANNVFCYCLASKTSIWAQPNDNGTNLALSKALSTNAKIQRSFFQTQFTTGNHNSVILDTWIAFVENERVEIIHLGENSATRGWRQSSLFPFSYEGRGWVDALADTPKGQTEVELVALTQFEFIKADHKVPCHDSWSSPLSTDYYTNKHRRAILVNTNVQCSVKVLDSHYRIQ
mmetsp:Transcript_2257/g.3534  ORF Transcript_2257/g.3534 Transcript_2257/m.3534 type:complete len:227 (-) Transcript_2257:902-1582(-)